MVSVAPTEEQLALGSAFEQVVAWLRRTRTATDISASGLSLLDRLATGGPQRITDLATQEGISQPAMTSLVNRLEERGWARRTADPDDRRAIRVELTSQGTERLERHRADRTRRIADRLTILDDADQAALLAALPALQRLTALPDPRTESLPGALTNA
ncbi:MarR family transcriptional regulator [Amnibacterium sp. CER49]|uniref:MarR family winged helix-turn-helix transcriptional regulator n=1 Tax=Amnibacterium sp. CER49 TaxID=3039161 RepID=UPI0024488861|nr:MarR family transcriptional regulator [Amnibacterium sp. CER49]MDH2443444.1 MarR family transcriptional regulator [Amnibacterium sp. CER49]